MRHGAGPSAPIAIAAGTLDPRANYTAARSSSNPTLATSGTCPESIIKVGSTYYMCYTRRVDTDTPHWHVGLAHASSPNPTSWTDDGSILTSGSQPWEDGTTNGTNGAWLMEDSGTFYLFYGSGQGTGGAIGYATAATVTGPWTKYASNPVFSPAVSGWDSALVGEPSVVNDGGTWLLAYMGEAVADGTTEQIGVATASSPSGPWTRASGNPVLAFGASGEPNVGGCSDPSWFLDGTRYWLWYTGLETASGGKPWLGSLAYATSSTGPYTKHAQNPIISTAQSTAFDYTAAFRGAVFRDSLTLYLIYTGLPSSASSADAKAGNAILYPFIRT